MLKRLILAAASLALLTACTSSSDSVSGTSSVVKATDGDPWASEEIDTVAAGEPPAFPTTLQHWTLQANWSQVTRGFTGNQWTTSAGQADVFPATMNGCNSQRFLVRWRALDEGANVLAGAIDGVGSPFRQVSGHAGWMDIDGCETPGFRLASDFADGQNLEDITVEVQQYWPAV